MMGCHGIAEGREENASLRANFSDGEEKWEAQGTKVHLENGIVCMCVYFDCMLLLHLCTVSAYLKLETWKKITMSGMTPLISYI